jgi:DNA-binding MarR family transcriptional regulator
MQGGKGNRRNQNDSRPGELMRNLLNEVAYTYFPLRAFGDQITARFGQSTAEWGLLRSLDERGEQTVAALARSRPVARQWIQRLANQLSHQGMLEFVENPDHKRAKLMRITPAGQTLLRQIAAVLEPRAAAMQQEFDERELSRTLDTMRKLRERLIAEYRRPKGSST